MSTAGTQATRTLFEGWAPTYDATVRAAFDPISGIPYDEFLARLAEALAPTPRSRVLEVAVGTGALAAALVRRWQADVRVVGVDASPRMLEVARANVQAAGLGEAIDLQEADATALPFPDASFDGVITSNALHHMDLPVVLGEVKRVLRPGGRLVVGDFLEPPRWRSLLGRIVVPPYRLSMRFSRDPARRADGGYATILPWKRWEALLAARGLTVDRHEDFPAPGLAQWSPVPLLVVATRLAGAAA